MALAPIPDTSLRFRYPARRSEVTPEDWNRLIRDLLDLQAQVSDLAKRVYELENPE